MRGGKWRLFRFFFGGQVTGIQNRCDIVEELLGRLNDEPQKVECRKWLCRARRAVQDPPVSYSAYDVAWGALQEIRHKLSASWLPPHDLVRIALDIRDDLLYLTKATKADQEKYQKIIEEISHEAYSLPEEQLKKKREKIFYLSLLSGNARSSYWHKVNVLRARLFITAVWMIVIEFMIASLLCIKGKDFGLSEQHPIVVLLVVLFGALGGFLSALQRQEPLGGRSVDFYLERSTLILRPVIGAAAGLLVYIVVRSGLVNILGTQPTTLPWAYFFVAFCAGFSERFFLKQIALVLDREGEPSPVRKEKERALPL